MPKRGFLAATIADARPAKPAASPVASQNAPKRDLSLDATNTQQPVVSTDSEADTFGHAESGAVIHETHTDTLQDENVPIAKKVRRAHDPTPSPSQGEGGGEDQTNEVRAIDLSPKPSLQEGSTEQSSEKVSNTYSDSDADIYAQTKAALPTHDVAPSPSQEEGGGEDQTNEVRAIDLSPKPSLQEGSTEQSSEKVSDTFSEADSFGETEKVRSTYNITPSPFQGEGGDEGEAIELRASQPPNKTFSQEEINAEKVPDTFSSTTAQGPPPIDGLGDRKVGGVQTRSVNATPPPSGDRSAPQRVVATMAASPHSGDHKQESVLKEALDVEGRRDADPHHGKDASPSLADRRSDAYQSDPSPSWSIEAMARSGQTPSHESEPVPRTPPPQPMLHIGQIDVIVEAPPSRPVERPRNQSPSAHSSSDMASRLYLRRL